MRTATNSKSVTAIPSARTTQIGTNQKRARSLCRITEPLFISAISGSRNFSSITSHTCTSRREIVDGNRPSPGSVRFHIFLSFSRFFAFSKAYQCPAIECHPCRRWKIGRSGLYHGCQLLLTLSRKRYSAWIIIYIARFGWTAPLSRARGGILLMPFNSLLITFWSMRTHSKYDSCKKELWSILLIWCYTKHATWVISSI